MKAGGVVRRLKEGRCGNGSEEGRHRQYMYRNVRNVRNVRNEREKERKRKSEREREEARNRDP